MEVYQKHEQRKEEPNEDAGCAQVAANWLRDPLTNGWTFIL